MQPKKNIVKQDDNKDYKKDNEGNYLVNYQIANKGGRHCPHKLL